MQYVVLLVLTLLCAFGTVPAVSQNRVSPKVDTVRITAALLAKGFNLDSARFRFHAGDDMRWKNAALDDSAWQFVRNDTAGKLLPSGIGWFRTIVRAAPEVVATAVSLDAGIDFGAAEVYFDGKLVYQAGKLSAVAENEEADGTTDLPTNTFIVLSDTLPHVLAMRASRWSAPFATMWFGWTKVVRKYWLPPGVLVEFASPTVVKQQAVRQMQQTVWRAFSLGVLVLMILLHGYMYILNPKDKTTLYFTLHVVAHFGMIIRRIVMDYTTISSLVFVLYRTVNAISSSLALVFLLFSVETYFKGRIDRWHIWLMVTLAAIDIAFNLVFEPQYISTGAFILLSLEVLRSITVHLYQNRRSSSAWILGVGVGLTGVFTLLDGVRLLIGQNLPNDVTRLLLYTAVPIAVTFVIVRRTAQDRAKLARYSEDLERDVAQRTTDLQSANEEISRQMDVQTEQAREIELANTSLTEAHEQSERLLLNVLPLPIALRLKSGESMIADRYESVSVLFADIVGFTKLSARTTPEGLVSMLDAMFSRFDTLAEQHGLEKIKTIGDAYMVVGGLPIVADDHCERVARFALLMQPAIEDLADQFELRNLSVRIGIHTGAVVAGVIGRKKFTYDLWGDTVNTASRMESHGETGRVHVSEEVYEVLKERFVFEERGAIEVKGKGVMRTWFLTETRPSNDDTVTKLL
jgi:class 3 adenylate cyclase